ncbi:type II secretion system secretin GspD [Paludibacterium paludis]|uniref:Type II secretion system protein GspD n=1 Tax=Paludibacterium paludis TaxID=1225769 RepID=A0A918NZK7_9NEIS|nr:type II secretion system secretin GspD [Paludibacterium paludis]GGY08142.1 type II secretion system protein GspD [Paludibacterium paludis]
MRLTPLVAAVTVCVASQALAAADEPIMLNFVNADIETVVKAIGEITGKNFIIDPRVKGTLNIVSSRPVPRSLSYQILLSSLRMQGFTAVEGRGVIKILPEAEAKLHAGVQKGRRSDGDRLITRVFTLKNGNANQMMPVIRPIVSPNNTVSVFPQANALVVTDYADNIRRIESIIESVESASGGDFAVLPVQFGAAVELAGMLTKLMQDSGGGDAGKITIIPDSRANVLLVRSDTPGKLGKIKSLLRTIDQPSQAGANVRVVYLKNADATRVAQILRTLMSSDAGQLQSSARSLPTASGSTMGGSSQGGASTASPASASTTQPATGGQSTDASQPGSAGSMIQADSANNALILNAPDTVYQNLRNVIDLLDRRRAQVYVETLVMEVSAKRLVDIGVQWQSLSGIGKNGTNVIGGTNFPTDSVGSTGIIGIAKNLGGLAQQPGLTIGVVKGSIDIPGVGKVANLGLLARALEDEAQGNVLANPNVMATDNEKALIEIGTEVPVLLASMPNNSASSSNPSLPYNTYDRKKFGFKLELTPQVSEGGAIRMRIHQESSAIDQTTINDPRGPTTSYRTFDTSVAVDDGGIIAIGGLIQEEVGNSEDKVPLLGDLPLIGYLFKHQVKQRNKTNLLVFLKPTILRDDLGAQAVAEDRYRYIIGESRKNATEKLPLDAESALRALPSGIKSLADQLRPADPKGSLPREGSQK